MPATGKFVEETIRALVLTGPGKFEIKKPQEEPIRIDPQSGKRHPTGRVAQVPTPVCGKTIQTVRK